MEIEPAASSDSTPPDDQTSEPVPAVPTRETTPVWANTVPVAPAESTEPVTEESAEEALPALPMQKGDPDWSKTEPGASAKADGTGAPAWAQTVPTSPGEPIDDETANAAPITDPPKSVASDAAKKTWPPAADGAPAPPEETDIWPPEPPTERAMPAWPPLSELEPEPVPPAEATPSWPESFDEVAAAAPETEAEAKTKPPAEPEPPATFDEAMASEPGEPAATSAPPEAVKPTVPPPPIAPTVTPAATKPSMPPAMSPKAEPTAPPQVPVAADAPPPIAASAPTAPPPAPTRPGKPTPVPGSAARPAWAPAVSNEPAAAQPKVDWPAPVQIPSWAPTVPPAAEPTTSHPGTPTWFSPREEVRHTSPHEAQPIAEPVPPPAPAPVPQPQPQPAAPLPVAPVPQPQPAAAKSTWEVVEQKNKAAKSPGISPEDRSYAEWFAWAKRGGAPASACHAAAQGAFQALTSGHDVATAVQWATAAMSRPPANVSFERQTYCAWFSLANIDLSLDQQRAHAFATAAIAALDAGQDASVAHAAGLAAAGIR